MKEQKENQKETQSATSKKKKKPKYKSLNTKNWGINFDKNEFQEIVLSNSNHPERM